MLDRSWLSGLRIALRSLGRTPQFTAAAVLTLALGIGASSAIFSFFAAVLLDPLPFPEADRLVALRKDHPQFQLTNMIPAASEVQRWSERARTVEAVTGFSSSRLTLRSGDGSRRIRAARVRPDLLELVDRQPKLGRSFSTDEYQPGAEPTVLVTESFWQTRFGGTAEALGEQLLLDGTAHTVIGVVPDQPVPELEAELVLPFVLDDQQLSSRQQTDFLVGLARMAAGSDSTAVQAELASLLSEHETDDPTGMDGWVPRVETLIEREVGQAAGTLRLLLAAVALVLLVACANVANLQLARSNSRAEELATRRALGATRSRLTWQLLGESAVLSSLGAALGLLLAAGLVRLMIQIAPPTLPRLDRVAVDARVMLFAVGLTLLCTFVSGLLPALQASRRTVGSTRTALGGGAGRGLQLREALVIAQLALGLPLLAAAGLLIQSLGGLLRIDPGFDTEQLVRAAIHLPDHRYEGAQQQNQMVLDLVSDLGDTVPAVSDAAAVSWSPLSGAWSKTGFVPEGEQATGTLEQNRFAFLRFVTPGYLEATGVPLLTGRGFDAALRAQPIEPTGPEAADSSSEEERKIGSAIVNQTMARTVWPDLDLAAVVGQRFNTGLSGNPDWLEVIGVAADVRQTDLRTAAELGYYRSYAESSYPAQTFELLLRTEDATPAALAALTHTVRERLAAIDPEIPLGTVAPLRSVVDRHLERPRFQLLLLGSLAALALLLSAVGIYGVVAYTTARRRNEVGLRIALGATARDVVALIGGRAVLLIGAGLGLGLIGALATSRFVESMLFDVTPRDPATLAGVSLVLALCAGIGVLIPARRATRVEPVEALRSE